MPPASKQVSDHRSEIVVAAGGATTLIALALVFALAHKDVNLMGWYANYVLPVGALLVGMCAATGYGIAAWLTGMKMTRRMMWSVVGQLTLSYFIAQYEEYRLMVPDGIDIGFWHWFDLTTRAFSFSSHSGAPGDALGGAGYFFRALEIGGFVAGGLLVPAILRAKPYCDPCRTYKRSKMIGWIPGGIVPSDGPYQGGLESLQALQRAAHEGDRATFERELEGRASLAKKRETMRMDERISLALVRCPRCAASELAPALHQGSGKHIKITKLPQHSLSSERVRELFD